MMTYDSFDEQRVNNPMLKILPSSDQVHAKAERHANIGINLINPCRMYSFSAASLTSVLFSGSAPLQVN